MKTAALTILSLFSLPLQAQAQVTELTLNCEYETSVDMKQREERMSGSFSAIVQMQMLKDGKSNATIRATTLMCAYFEGSFDELTVRGECERTIGSSLKVHASLQIDRINGVFDNTLIKGDSLVIYSGRCTPAKKLF
jgi:hypothetical protein